MNVLVLTYGTRGDVQPFVALARELVTARHGAVLAAPASFASLAAPYSVPFAPLDDDALDILADPAVRLALERGGRGPRVARGALDLARRPIEMVARGLDDVLASAGEIDVIVHPPGIPAHLIAGSLGVPAVPAGLQPGWVPLRQRPAGFPRILQWQMQVLLWLTDRWGRQLLKVPHRRGRSTSLRRADGSPATVLQAFSRHLLPASAPVPAWLRTTGFWFLPAAPDWAPPPPLADFLAAGEPPVYIGFGSMAGPDPAARGRMVIEAIQRAGARTVLSAGWGGLVADEVPADVFVLDQAPHDWLFPRMAAIVHHGGSGTTGAALAAGRPQVVCPFGADQPFWAASMHAQGVSPAPKPQAKLTADWLARAIAEAMTSQQMANRAAELGALVRAEEGVTAAVRVVEEVFASHQRAPVVQPRLQSEVHSIRG